MGGWVRSVRAFLLREHEDVFSIGVSGYCWHQSFKRIRRRRGLRRLLVSGFAREFVAHAWRPRRAVTRRLSSLASIACVLGADIC